MKSYFIKFASEDKFLNIKEAIYYVVYLAHIRIIYDISEIVPISRKFHPDSSHFYSRYFDINLFYSTLVSLIRILCSFYVDFFPLYIEGFLYTKNALIPWCKNLHYYNYRSFHIHCLRVVRLGIVIFVRNMGSTHVLYLYVSFIWNEILRI